MKVRPRAGLCVFLTVTQPVISAFVASVVFSEIETASNWQHPGVVVTWTRNSLSIILIVSTSIVLFAIFF